MDREERHEEIKVGEVGASYRGKDKALERKGSILFWEKMERVLMRLYVGGEGLRRSSGYR